jgi:transposase
MLSSGLKDLSKDELVGLVEQLLSEVSALRERVTALDVENAALREENTRLKGLTVNDRRYIVCRNEAENDREDRQAVIQALDAKLKMGEKTLIGKSAYRRYPRRAGALDQEVKAAFEIDAGKLADEARFDGIFVLRVPCQARITPLQDVLRCRDLLQVEELLRSARSLLRTRPVYHSSDAAIRGHVFCSFLALILRKELQARCDKAGMAWCTKPPRAFIG